MMGSVDNKKFVLLPVENNSCSSCIYYEIIVMQYIINILFSNKPIDEVDSHTPYFDVFVWSSCSIPEEVSNIATQPILSLSGEPDIGRSRYNTDS